MHPMQGRRVLCARNLHAADIKTAATRRLHAQHAYPHQHLAINNNNSRQHTSLSVVASLRTETSVFSQSFAGSSAGRFLLPPAAAAMSLAYWEGVG